LVSGIKENTSIIGVVEWQAVDRSKRSTYTTCTLTQIQDLWGHIKEKADGACNRHVIMPDT